MDQDKDEVIFELIDDFTSGSKLYFHNESLWMISPKTKEWIFEFTKSGKLWYSYPVFKNIFKWISMQRLDFQPYIKKWVERILQNEVKYTLPGTYSCKNLVERILQNEVKYTCCSAIPTSQKVERILQNEVKYILSTTNRAVGFVERILQNEVKIIESEPFEHQPMIETILENYKYE